MRDKKDGDRNMRDKIYWFLVSVSLGVILCGSFQGCVSVKKYRETVLEINNTIIEQQRTIQELNEKTSDADRLLAREIDNVRFRLGIQEKVFSDSIGLLENNKQNKSKTNGTYISNDAKTIINKMNNPKLEKE